MHIITDIITMMSGERVKVKTKSYQNDMVTFKNKDDVLTALIHLGYLAYDRREQMAYIPNEEIRSEFTDAVKEHQCIIEKYRKNKKSRYTKFKNKSPIQRKRKGENKYVEI
mgnify:CR=1 FL=1